MYSPEVTTTGLQKVLIGLFATTILLACVSLVWYQIEKPNLKSTRCEQLGKGTSYVSDSYKVFNNNSGTIMPKLQRNCTTTENPPISPGLQTTIDLTTFCGFLFVSAAICAYVFRKKIIQDKPVELKEEDKKP